MIKRWAIEECYPGTIGPGDPIDPDCIIVAQFFTRRGAQRWMELEWPVSTVPGAQISHGLVRWHKQAEEWVRP